MVAQEGPPAGPPLNALARRAVVAARFASLLAAGAGLAVLIGWLADVPPLTSLYLPGPTIKTNAAISLICAGLANLLLISPFPRREVDYAAYLLATIPTSIGALTLSEHLTGWDLGIDQLIASEPVGAMATVSPNRMGPPASTAHLLLGLALLLGSRRTGRGSAAAHLLAFAAGVIALLGVLGYAYGLSQLYAVARFTGIALVTAIALLVLSIAIQAGRPGTGLAALLCREDEVGVFARQMLPAAVLLPFSLGWLLTRARGLGLVDEAFAIAAMALVLIVLLAAVIWRTGAQLVLSLDARAETERALGESERTLRETDHQKTEFLATLSHELRNPLAPIRFAVELLNGPPATAERARHTIQRQVGHLTRLIDDLLDLTRITRNKLNLHVRPSQLQPLVNDAVDAVAIELARGRHELQVELPPQAIWLQVDPDRVVQMLVNLVTNAARYSDPGGRVTISAAVDHENVTIAVRDTGHGIARADLERVFERFVQVGATRHGGLGIGLALVRALAELHGGRVEANSEGPGKGSEFRLRLPRAEVPTVESRGHAEVAETNCRILVVDDNRDAADMLAGLMTAAGHAVAVAYDSVSALRSAESFEPSVGLLDIGMPGMDGYHLAGKLRSRWPELFLVAITGWGQEEDRRQALAAGFDAHLTKPADPAAIAALLAARFPASGAPAARTARL